jgi:hypothetical protein
MPRFQNELSLELFTRSLQHVSTSHRLCYAPHTLRPCHTIRAAPKPSGSQDSLLAIVDAVLRHALPPLDET